MFDHGQFLLAVLIVEAKVFVFMPHKLGPDVQEENQRPKAV